MITQIAKLVARVKSKSPYYANKKVRGKIDKLLQKNSVIWSNIGTGSKEDPITREEGNKRWKTLAKEIKALDEEFYKIVCPYGADS